MTTTIEKFVTFMYAMGYGDDAGEDWIRDPNYAHKRSAVAASWSYKQSWSVCLENSAVTVYWEDPEDDKIRRMVMSAAGYAAYLGMPVKFEDQTAR